MVFCCFLCPKVFVGPQVLAEFLGIRRNSSEFVGVRRNSSEFVGIRRNSSEFVGAFWISLNRFELHWMFFWLLWIALNGFLALNCTECFELPWNGLNYFVTRWIAINILNCIGMTGITLNLFKCLELLWIALECFDMLWHALRSFELRWQALNYFGLLMFAWNCVCLLINTLKDFGFLWTGLNAPTCFEMLRLVLNCYGMLWNVLSCFRLLWTVPREILEINTITKTSAIQENAKQIPMMRAWCGNHKCFLHPKPWRP